MILRESDMQILGRGRSGVVMRSQDAAGRLLARKIFVSDPLIKLVHYFFSGAPNPYIWSAPAIRSAVLRRRILDVLVEFWFGAKLRVARGFDHAWNEQFLAFEMHCELIDGRHVALHHPFTPQQNHELWELRKLMKLLQRRLTEAGFDGLVWQAGRGNPVALNNFMYEDTGKRWVWIDLESGVPALIPINPLDLLLFYLPKSLRHRGPLFDDVDIGKLRGYLDANRRGLEDQFGASCWGELNTDIKALERDQREWKSLARHRRSIAYRLAKCHISQTQADWYALRPLRWYRLELTRGLRSGLRGIVGSLRWIVHKLANINLKSVLRACCLLAWSQEYRDRLARDYVALRVARWEKRRQLTETQASQLRDDLEKEEASSYLSDFGVHVAVKPLVKVLQWWLLPALWAMGAINLTMLGLLAVSGGAIVRTLYTLGRLIQSARAGCEKPWIALIVGVIPMVGNLAYPVQIIFSGAHKHAKVAQFMLYDTFSQFGRLVPIWGGCDTLTEHLFNRCPDVLVRSHSSEPAASLERD